MQCPIVTLLPMQVKINIFFHGGIYKARIMAHCKYDNSLLRCIIFETYATSLDPQLAFKFILKFSCQAGTWCKWMLQSCLQGSALQLGLAGATQAVNPVFC